MVKSFITLTPGGVRRKADGLDGVAELDERNLGHGLVTIKKKLHA
jgi:hypothetical protein